MTPSDDTSLHAYVDQQLSPDDALAMARWLQEHPEQSRQADQWRTQRLALQGLHSHLLDEGIPPAMLARWHAVEQPIAQAANEAWWRGRQQVLAALALVLCGAVAGLGLDRWLSRLPDAALASAAMQAPAFVRDAQIAHVLYQPEQRHPVEVGADQQAHLVQWLSKRLGEPLKTPDWTEQGFSLVGGRLLPAGSEPQARAQFMYQRADGKRVTLYVTVMPTEAAQPAAFEIRPGQMGSHLEGQTFYWLQGRLGYAITGAISSQELIGLAAQTYEQLEMASAQFH